MNQTIKYLTLTTIVSIASIMAAYAACSPLNNPTFQSGGTPPACANDSQVSGNCVNTSTHGCGPGTPYNVTLTKYKCNGWVNDVCQLCTSNGTTTTQITPVVDAPDNQCGG